MESKVPVPGPQAVVSANEATPLLDLRPASKQSAEELLQHAASLSTVELFALLRSSHSGLSQADAQSRLDEYGPNRPAQARRPTWYELLGTAALNPFNVLLVAIAAVSAGISPDDWTTVAILGVMVIMSTSLRFWQELKSQQTAIDLQQQVQTLVKVVRHAANRCHELSMPSTNLVPGDVALLKAGDVVPADCIVLAATGLTVSQSAFTGESQPQQKAPAPKDTSHIEKALLFERANVLVASSAVVSGSARVCVVCTGTRTCLAAMAQSLNRSPPLNAAQRGIRNVSYVLVAIVVLMTILVFVINGVTKGDWFQALVFSLSVGVGVVPEMLPAIVNANLLRGAQVLSRQKVVVKRIDAIQNIGAMSVLCSDKTGTLTADAVSLESAVNVHGESCHETLRLAYLDSFSQGASGNNLDHAILEMGAARQLVADPSATPIAFSFETRRSGVLTNDKETETGFLVVKGALEEILALCGFLHDGTRPCTLDAPARDALHQRCADLNSHGLRVLGVATVAVNKDFAPSQRSIDQYSPYYIFRGMLTFSDPPKPDSAAALANLASLGVETKVLTGDNLGTALRVCAQVGLRGPSVTGPELEQMGADQLVAACARCSVFAKLVPAQKALIIATLQARGHTVGMLGDGINDCLALRTADVGISVDTATPAAADCAALLLTARHLNAVVAAVRTGRITHGNTLKYIKMAVSSNFGNVASIVVASAWLPFEPMTALQLLLQNLLYDVSQTAIPWDAVDEAYLAQPRRWCTADLVRFALVLGPTSSTIDLCTFALGWWYYGAQSGAGVALFRTHWFLQGLVTQTLVVHLLRTPRVPFAQSTAAPAVLVMTAVVTAVGVALPLVPGIAGALAFVAPAPSFWAFLAAELVVYFVEVQLVKGLYLRWFHAWL